MIEFVTILAAVTLANVVSMFLITAYNIQLDKKLNAKRREAFEKALANFDEKLEKAAAKKTVKKATVKRVKKD